MKHIYMMAYVNTAGGIEIMSNKIVKYKGVRGMDNKTLAEKKTAFRNMVENDFKAGSITYTQYNNLRHELDNIDLYYCYGLYTAYLILHDYDVIITPQPSKNSKPKHYDSKSDIDVIDFCNMYDLDFTEGNIIKYKVRYKKKNGIEDIFKANEYIQRLIQRLGK